MNLQNQRGLSLLEVLASLTLLTVVLGVAFLLFGSVNSLFNDSAQDYTDKTDLRTTMNTISDQMADATLVRLHNATELRFRTFEMTSLQARAIVYNAVDRTISLYLSTDASFDLSTGAFTQQQVLAENVEPNTAQAIPAFTVSNVTSGNSVDLAIGDTLEDVLIRISVNFALTRIGANNQKIITYKQLESIIPTVKAELY